MLRRRPILALLVALSILPGLAEAVENGVHLVTEGHLAHDAASGDEHSAPGPEHGCSTTMHLCHCCASLSVVAERPALALSPDELERGRVVEPGSVGAIAPAAGLDHPPRV